MQTVTGATDAAAFEARYDIGAASTEIDIIKQHLGGTAGVMITCVRGPDMMAGRMEEELVESETETGRPREARSGAGNDIDGTVRG